MEKLEEIAAAMEKTAKEAGVRIVSGDTKVAGKGPGGRSLYYDNRYAVRSRMESKLREILQNRAMRSL